jgi:glycosyltransferase involved in cell wall biosynthesis
MSLSICIIARDEEANIERCLISAKKVADEIVVVDTGSKDRTVEIAAKYADVLVKHQWGFDFAEARNVSIEHASKDWILWLDADDEIHSGAIERIKYLAEGKEHYGYDFAIENVGVTEKEIVKFQKFMQLRMFPRIPGIKFEGMIHEQVAYSISRKMIPRADHPLITILHHGYADSKKLIGKIMRNNRITLYEMGFAKGADFLEFAIDKFIMFWMPNCLAIFNGTELISCVDTQSLDGLNIFASTAILSQIACKEIEDKHKKSLDGNAELHDELKRLEASCDEKMKSITTGELAYDKPV